MKALKRKRVGKKALITRKMIQTGELVSGRGSRTKLTYLKDKLSEVIIIIIIIIIMIIIISFIC